MRTSSTRSVAPMRFHVLGVAVLAIVCFGSLGMLSRADTPEPKTEETSQCNTITASEPACTRTCPGDQPGCENQLPAGYVAGACEQISNPNLRCASYDPFECGRSINCDTGLPYSDQHCFTKTYLSWCKDI